MSLFSAVTRVLLPILAGMWLFDTAFPKLPLPRGARLEIRRCHPVANEDESQRSLTCSCKVADWIRDGEQQILVCAEEENKHE